MAGLIAAVREGRIGPDTTTVFLHTGGLPGLFADQYLDQWQLPATRSRAAGSPTCPEPVLRRCQLVGPVGGWGVWSCGGAG